MQNELHRIERSRSEGWKRLIASVGCGGSDGVAAFMAESAKYNSGGVKARAIFLAGTDGRRPAIEISCGRVAPQKPTRTETSNCRTSCGANLQPDCRRFAELQISALRSVIAHDVCADNR